ncbi:MULTISPECIES: hypothetical protein [unclassified Rhodococcus (in: high G+C Gram-positive bacteria)]|uniref:hypothetical protein n=1 Tax=unclassified Rhodococcus (in: high G+C Gram-positive bacteria) TaxID=192944 RepID=UPI0015C5CC53|nr:MULTISPECIES: hypothetical protein [unclassified Rhodococcus (in: high G+C Gram-positive bacteria)]
MASSTYRTEWSNADLQQDVSEAGWVDDSLKVVAETTVGSLVPTVFDAYARIDYPARNGRPNPLSPAKTVVAWHVQLVSIIEVLARSTNTPKECWFAVWEGNTALDDIRETAVITVNYDQPTNDSDPQPFGAMVSTRSTFRCTPKLVGNDPFSRYSIRPYGVTLNMPGCGVAVRSSCCARNPGRSNTRTLPRGLVLKSNHRYLSHTKQPCNITSPTMLPSDIIAVKPLPR